MPNRLLVAVASALLTADPAHLPAAPAERLDGCTYLASPALAAGFVETDPLASQVITQPAGTSLTVDSRVTRFRSGDPDDYGEVVIARDRDDTVHSVIRQAGDQAHLRLSFGKDRSGTGRPQHLLIGPYNYGAAVEYPGVIEFWVAQFSVHNNHASSMKKEGAWFWVGDQIDAGGLFATSYYDPDLSKAWSSIASDMFGHTSHGSLHFQLRDQQDAFRFQWGPFEAETTLAEFGRTTQSTYLSMSSGAVAGYLEASAGTGAMRLGSQAGTRLDLLAGGSLPTLSVLPTGGVEIAEPAGYLAIGGAPAAAGALRLCATCGINFASGLGSNIEGLAASAGATQIHDRRYAASLEGFYPAEDGVRDLGLPTHRWDEVWATRLQTSGPVVSGFNLVPASATPEFDAALGNTQKIVLAEDVTESSLVNAMPGQALQFIVCQDDTGKHKFVWPTNVRGAMNVAPQAGRCNAQSFVFDGTTAWATSPGVINQ